MSEGMRGAFAARQATRDALGEAKLRFSSSLRIWSADRTPENLALHVQTKKALSLAVPERVALFVENTDGTGLHQLTPYGVAVRRWLEQRCVALKPKKRPGISDLVERATLTALGKELWRPISHVEAIFAQSRASLRSGQRQTLRL